MTRTQLIQRLGETDQLYLQQNSPELALERGELRLRLVALSQQKQEQIYFLQQTLVILEQARIEFDEIDLTLYLDLSICLGQAYMTYFDISHEQKYALIAQQILKPLAHYERRELYQLLYNSAIAQQHPAMAQHWQKKMQVVMPASESPTYS